MRNPTTRIYALCLLVLAGLSGCKEQNTPEQGTTTPQQEQIARRHLTIRMQERAGAPVRRVMQATIEDLGTTLSSAWTAGDEASYCNLNRQKQNPMTEEYEVYTGPLTAASTGNKSDLNGDVECTAGDWLAVVYPANSTFEYTAAGNKYSYTFPLSGQDGTLETLATQYNQQYGRAQVLSVTDQTAEAEMAKMQSLLTVCKFSFVEKDHEGDGALPINTLTISYGGSGSDAGKYPQTASVTVDVLTENGEANTVKEEGSTTPLTINAGGATEVYVALLPTSASRTYIFTVTNGNGTYTGTAEAWLKKGEFIPALDLKLQ